MKKKPVMVHLNQQEIDWLNAESEKEGLSKSSIIRRLIKKSDPKKEKITAVSQVVEMLNQFIERNKNETLQK